jgi:hypothetical protein
MLTSLYPIFWALIHTISKFTDLTDPSLRFDYRFSEAVAEAFKFSPHSFIVGGLSVMIAIQLISLGILALQNKRYFEELFHQSSTPFIHAKHELKENNYFVRTE